ncbi:divalent-cation tolerance protein CutA [Oryzibacter oryziterrae]|uniref:divalent-cation tolerance protein CutA n=1 Tax=Oryzibacter oryziterrae TaxID=2766474 RepID=UPI001F182F67|nr:divalent-cation tolerance protein CutA [Oryzibacter oryziterrae]
MSRPPLDLRIVNVTCPDLDVAKKIGRLVVDRRLAACANIVPGVFSIYRWMGEVNEDEEVLLSLKTRDEFVESLFTAIVANHPYQQPAIEVLGVEAAGRGVAAWIKAETGGEASVSLPKSFKGAED